MSNIRELKFRAWHPELKCFIYFHNLEMIHQNKYSLSASESIEISGGSHVYHCWDRVAPIQQFTGLKDKDGKEIYEGDIIKFQKTIVRKSYHNYNYKNPIFGNSEIVSWIAEVVFDKINDCDDFYTPTMLAWGLKNKSSISSLCGKIEGHNPISLYDGTYWQETGKSWEIIGNIFENSELLK